MRLLQARCLSILGLPFLFFSASAACFAQEGSSTLPPILQKGISDPPATQNLELSEQEKGKILKLASKVAEKARRIGCYPGSCRILVDNFVLSDGKSSPYLIQFADAMSAGIAAQQKNFQTVDRIKLQEFVQRNRLAYSVQGEDAVARWTATSLNADAVLVGVMKHSKNNLQRISLTLLSARKFNNERYSLEEDFPFTHNLPDLQASDGLLPLPTEPASFGGEAIIPLQTKGLKPPRCTRMDSPAYTDEARSQKFSGTLIVEGVIQSDGTLKPIWFVRGLPYGLNDNALQKMRSWVCSPAIYEGKAVATTSQFEVTFRLY